MTLTPETLDLVEMTPLTWTATEAQLQAITLAALPDIIGCHIWWENNEKLK